jgi:hypothetical protein
MEGQHGLPLINVGDPTLSLQIFQEVMAQQLG